MHASIKHGAQGGCEDASCTTIVQQRCLSESEHLDKDTYSYYMLHAASRHLLCALTSTHCCIHAHTQVQTSSAFAFTPSSPQALQTLKVCKHVRCEAKSAQNMLRPSATLMSILHAFAQMLRLALKPCHTDIVCMSPPQSAPMGRLGRPLCAVLLVVESPDSSANSARTQLGHHSQQFTRHNNFTQTHVQRSNAGRSWHHTPSTR